MAYRNNRKVAGYMPLVFALSIQVGLSLFSTNTFSADYAAAELLYFSGDYDQCAAIARAEVERGVWNEKWPVLLMRCQLTRGQYEAAVATFERAVERFKTSLELLMAGREAYRYVNDPDKSDEQTRLIVEYLSRSPWRYSSSADRVRLGRFALSLGDDAREVLEKCYDRAKQSNAKLPDVYVATAELALEKHDYQEAAKSLEIAAELQPYNPDICLLQARAWRESDSDKATASILRALELNPRHVPSMLLQVDQLIDAERYDDARDLLTQILAVNHRQPEAWAYHAVIAHLTGHEDAESALRDAALSPWSANPYVDHLIGNKLSQKYRFAEGARYQRLALLADPNLLAAKFQLSQDLLRLGIDEEGWRLAAEVHEADGYNVVAYNVITLRDEIAKFSTIETDRFIIRMDAREARIYGQQVAQLLTEAHDVLCAKYNETLDAPVTVEIFPQQKDFAIRTFGLPGGAGFLGVCFGRVITANSPASQGERPANWRSVLWHEFCHVVTLEKTSNKIPRWLSEGISVYEEQEKDPSWGERLTPAYRMLVLGDEFTPVSQLSGAFLRPKSPIHLQFAYYESSLVVRYIVEKHGIETIQRVLDDLSVGMPINESLGRYIGSIDELDENFATYARERVNSIAADVDWEQSPDVATLSLPDAKQWLETHPNHYQALTHYAQLAIEAEQFKEAEQALLHLQELYAEDRELDGTLALLALLYRKTERPEQELEVLRELARLNDRALNTYIRLAELQSMNGDWSGVRESALRFLSVNPLLPSGHELLAKAAERLEQHEEMALALTAMLEMNPIDPAGIHYRIAAAHDRAKQHDLAKRHALMALEQAPRYRAAQRLLLQLVKEN